MVEFALNETDGQSGPYIANGGQTVFDFDFPIFDEGDIAVYLQENGSASAAIQTLNNDYMVSGIEVANGGYITFTSPLSSGDKVTIIREVTINRLVDYQARGEYRADVVNRDFDRIIQMIQDKDREMNSAVKFPPIEARVRSETELPALSERAGRVLAFNSVTGLIESGPEKATLETLITQGISELTADPAAIVSSISNMRDLDSSQLVGGEIIRVTEAKRGGDFVVRIGVAAEDSGLIFNFSDGGNGKYLDRAREGDIIKAAWFGINANSGVDETVRINGMLSSFSRGRVRFEPGDYILSGQSGNSPDEYAVEDGDMAPDAPEDGAIILRNRMGVTLDLAGVKIISGNCYAILMYRCDGCHVIGHPEFQYSGTIGSAQPAAIAMIRCIKCKGGGTANGHYRLFLGLKNACCKWQDFVALNSNYFAVVMIGLLDVSVNGNSTWIGKKWTNQVLDGVARNCQYGSFFGEFTFFSRCLSFDMDNSTVAGHHFSLQTGPYKANDCHIFDTSDQNSGLKIYGFTLTGSGIAPASSSGSGLYDCSVSGCYISVAVGGGDDIVIDGVEVEDYYATGIAVVTAPGYEINTLRLKFFDKGLNPLSTRTQTGDVKIAGLQIEKNTGEINDVLVDGCVLNFDRRGTTSPAGTAYTAYIENVAGLRLGKNMTLSVTDSYNFEDFDTGIITATADDTTPSVLKRNIAGISLLTYPANTVPTEITQLDDGTPGQTVFLRAGSSTNPPTITDGGNFQLEGDWNGGINDTIVLYNTGGIWFELSRSNN